jgi:hypothetical protein
MGLGFHRPLHDQGDVSGEHFATTVIAIAKLTLRASEI